VEGPGFNPASQTNKKFHKCIFGWRLAKAIEHLLCKCEAKSSNLGPTKKIQTNKLY
jgi:hypothetical protein